MIALRFYGCRFAMWTTVSTAVLFTSGVVAHAKSNPDDDAANDSEAPLSSSYETTRESELSLNGYIDVGYAAVQGNGTSFAPGDTRIPADYVADPFATAVNSRGDVASTDSGGRFTNGFLPRSVGIGGNPSFLINAVNQDLRYCTSDDRLMIFARAQLLPRFTSTGNETRLWVEQAFARIIPFSALEMALSVGKFDSVVGIEYLDNPSNLRTGITPSLIARYTTGQGVGAKLFHRFHIAPLWSSFSFNVSATNGGSEVESLQPVDISLAGRPVLAGRIGYELNLPWFQIKLGGSGLRGPRNDQTDRHVQQTLWGLDARLYVAGVSLSGEWIHFDEGEGTGAKFTGQGVQVFASDFEVRGLWTQLAYRLPFSGATFTGTTLYVRVERRRAQFPDVPLVEGRRLTAGARFDLWSNVAVKGEWLFNGEAAGALPVANNVKVASVVFSW